MALSGRSCLGNEDHMGQFGKYMRFAFGSQVNLLTLVAMLLAGFVTWNPLPIYAAAAGEALWLILAPLTPAFRRHADDTERRMANASAHPLTRPMIDSLPAAYQQSYFHTLDCADDIRAAARRLNPYAPDDAEPTASRLDDLAYRYLKVLSVSRSLEDHIRDVERRNGRNPEDEDPATFGDALIERRKKALESAPRHAMELRGKIAAIEEGFIVLHRSAPAARTTAEIARGADDIEHHVATAERLSAHLDEYLAYAFERPVRKIVDTVQ